MDGGVAAMATGWREGENEGESVHVGNEMRFIAEWTGDGKTSRE